MGGGIFVLQKNGGLVEMKQEPYNAEALLQQLIEDYPALLAGDQINSAYPRRWLLVKREMDVPDSQNGSGRWSLDHLFLDQDGVPTLVEVKRSTDTRIRREVIGQMLDYAANGVAYWPVVLLQSRFAATWKDKADQVLTEFLQVETGDDTNAESGTANIYDVFWKKVSENLKAGNLRLLFVADEIPTELQRVVEFLNEKMDTVEVLAVEIKQYTGQQMKTLVPRIIGQTAKAITQKERAGGTAEQWNATRFFEKMEAGGSQATTHAARKILEWAETEDLHISWGKGQNNGSFVPYLDHKGIRHSLFAIYSDGWFETYFPTLRNRPPFAELSKRQELLKRLISIQGVSLPPDSVDKRRSIKLSVFDSAAKIDALIDILNWIVQEIKAT